MYKVGFIFRFLVFGCLLFVISANAANYNNYVEDIKGRFDKAYHLYNSGNDKEAKAVLSSAYFEVFENLEGPIRINISAKKSYLMESQFTNLRKMVKKKVTPEELKEAMDNLQAELHEVLPQINGGTELIAEGIDGDEPILKTPTQEKKINLTWQKAIEYIQNSLDKSLVAYLPENSKKARSFVQNAQFEGYRNSGIETAIRKNVSSYAEQEMQKKFTSLIHFMHTKPTKELVKVEIDSLISSLSKLARGLPLVDVARVVETKVKVKKDFSKVLDNINKEFDKAFYVYEKGNKKEAITIVQNTYFDIFEASGMEIALGAKNVTLKVEIESYFSKIIALIKNGSSIEDIKNEFSKMQTLLNEGLNILNGENKNFLTLFIYSLTIILREGFEALLIVTAIIAYLVKSGNGHRLNIVYSSLFTAIGLSFVTAFVMNIIFGSAAAENREILEGSVMLVASALLLYVSYWLLSNASAQKWTNYIKQQVKESLDDNSVKALWFTVFLAVYREGAETVLFYQALIVDASTPTDYMALSSGFAVGLLALIILYFIMKFTAIKLPIKPFFIFTGIFIYIMAFMFIGRAVMEFVEGKIIEPTLITGIPTISFIGIYPYMESLIPQAIVLALGVFGLIILRKNKLKQKE